jgi:uncharacterized membrane protein
LVAKVLKIGVIISGILILSGLGLYLLTDDTCYQFGEPSLDWIIYGDPFLAPSHLLFIGFIVLVITPLLRVAASVIAYMIEGDLVYTSITSFVLVILLLGMALGLG